IGARFMLTRKLLKGSPFYATVFTQTKKQTKALLDFSDERKKATVIARVIVKPPTPDWKGFFLFEKRPKPHPYALLVDEIVIAETSPTCAPSEKSPPNPSAHASA